MNTLLNERNKRVTGLAEDGDPKMAGKGVERKREGGRGRERESDLQGFNK